jgi:hypothetical protein
VNSFGYEEIVALKRFWNNSNEYNGDMLSRLRINLPVNGKQEITVWLEPTFSENMSIS